MLSFIFANIPLGGISVKPLSSPCWASARPLSGLYQASARRSSKPARYPRQVSSKHLSIACKRLPRLRLANRDFVDCATSEFVDLFVQACVCVVCMDLLSALRSYKCACECELSVFCKRSPASEKVRSNSLYRDVSQRLAPWDGIQCSYL